EPDGGGRAGPVSVPAAHEPTGPPDGDRLPRRHEQPLLHDGPPEPPRDRIPTPGDEPSRGRPDRADLEPLPGHGRARAAERPDAPPQPLDPDEQREPPPGPGRCDRTHVDGGG